MSIHSLLVLREIGPIRYRVYALDAASVADPSDEELSDSNVIRNDLAENLRYIERDLYQNQALVSITSNRIWAFQIGSIHTDNLDHDPRFEQIESGELDKYAVSSHRLEDNVALNNNSSIYQFLRALQSFILQRLCEFPSYSRLGCLLYRLPAVDSRAGLINHDYPDSARRKVDQSLIYLDINMLSDGSLSFGLAQFCTNLTPLTDLIKEGQAYSRTAYLSPKAIKAQVMQREAPPFEKSILLLKFFKRMVGKQYSVSSLYRVKLIESNEETFWPEQLILCHNVDIYSSKDLVNFHVDASNVHSDLVSSIKSTTQGNNGAAEITDPAKSLFSVYPTPPDVVNNQSATPCRISSKIEIEKDVSSRGKFDELSASAAHPMTRVTWQENQSSSIDEFWSETPAAKVAPVDRMQWVDRAGENIEEITDADFSFFDEIVVVNDNEYDLEKDRIVNSRTCAMTERDSPAEHEPMLIDQLEVAQDLSPNCSFQRYHIGPLSVSPEPCGNQFMPEGFNKLNFRNAKLYRNIDTKYSPGGAFWRPESCTDSDDDSLFPHDSGNSDTWTLSPSGSFSNEDKTVELGSFTIVLDDSLEESAYLACLVSAFSTQDDDLLNNVILKTDKSEDTIFLTNLEISSLIQHLPFQAFSLKINEPQIANPNDIINLKDIIISIFRETPISLTLRDMVECRTDLTLSGNNFSVDLPCVNKSSIEFLRHSSGEVGLDVISPPAFIVSAANNGSKRTLLEVQAPALQFWEKYSFAPFCGGTDIGFFAIMFDNEDMRIPLASFLDRLMDTYVAYNLGASTLVNLGNDYHGFCIIDKCDDYKTKLSSLARLFSKLTSNLQQNVCIIFCGTFQTSYNELKFWEYFSFLTKEYDSLVSCSLRHSFSFFVVDHSIIKAPPITTNAYYITMRSCAFKIKELAGKFETKSNLMTHTPTSVLARESLTGITFKSTGNASFHDHGPLLHDQTFLHVMYSISGSTKSDYWITVSLADSYGELSEHDIYSITGSAEQRKNAYIEALRAIWRWTTEKCANIDISWHVAVAKFGCFQQDEISIWNSIFSSVSTFKGSFYLVSLRYCTSLGISPVIVSSTTNSSSKNIINNVSPQILYTTPAATPMTQWSPGTPSYATVIPAPGTNDSITIDDTQIDGEMTIINACDQVYGFVLNEPFPFGGPVALGDSDCHVPQISGCLYTDNGRCLIINMIASRTNLQNQIESRVILNRLLICYRNLACLKRYNTGIQPSDEELLPWPMVCAIYMGSLFQNVRYKAG